MNKKLLIAQIFILLIMLITNLSIRIGGNLNTLQAIDVSRPQLEAKQHPLPKIVEQLPEPEEKPNEIVNHRASLLALIPPQDREHAEYIFNSESNFQSIWSKVDNNSYGVCQTNLDVHQVPQDFIENPKVQVLWCHEYALERYGSWENARRHWEENGNW